jgi:hypothetical protein
MGLRDAHLTHLLLLLSHMLGRADSAVRNLVETPFRCPYRRASGPGSEADGLRAGSAKETPAAFTAIAATVPSSHSRVVPAPLLSKSTSVGGVAQQLARGFGVAIAAALLAMVAGSSPVTVDDFELAFFLIALIPLLSALGFLGLSPVDGAEVSGHRRAKPRSA